MFQNHALNRVVQVLGSKASDFQFEKDNSFVIRFRYDGRNYRFDFERKPILEVLMHGLLFTDEESRQLLADLIKGANQS